MKMSRIAAIAAVSAAALSVPASANHSWNGYHWATTGSLTVRVNASVTGQWPAYVDEAIVDWERSTELSLGSRINVPADPKRCNPISGQILVCNTSYGKRGWLGIATIWLSNGHISQGTTKLNDSYFNTASYNTPAWRRLVTCQEIGHDFGLAHQNEGFGAPNLGSCMDYTNDPDGGGAYGPSNEHPNQHDYDQLVQIYNHNDGFTTATSGATNFGVRQMGQRPPVTPRNEEALGDSPSDWGRAIHTDGRGRPDVFVKDLGAGRKAITHVFWALETKRSDIHDEDH
jgi:hypothetical protein